MVQLFAHGVNDFGVHVAEREHAVAAAKIEIRLAVVVENCDSLALPLPPPRRQAS